MKEITPGLPVKVVVDVLRQASKVNFSLFILLDIIVIIEGTVSLQNVSTEQQSVVHCKEIP